MFKRHRWIQIIDLPSSTKHVPSPWFILKAQISLSPPPLPFFHHIIEFMLLKIPSNWIKKKKNESYMKILEEVKLGHANLDKQ